MRYALLINLNPGSYDGLSEQERAAINAEYLALRDDARIVGGEQLQTPDTATTVRVEGGQSSPPASRPHVWAARWRCGRWLGRRRAIDRLRRDRVHAEKLRLLERRPEPQEAAMMVIPDERLELFFRRSW